MVLIKSGLNHKGEVCEFFMEENLVKNAEPVKKVVQTKDFDFVTIIAGIPGAGKTNFSITLAKFFDPDFNIDKICFTADDFISVTNQCPKHSAVILDESFASLNTKVGMSTDFLRIINHLQLLRQKNLFIILNLPNFFDLHKGISLYRSSWLFVVYSESFGLRGTFSAYDRDSKRILFVKGSKYMDYNCVRPNFRGRFTRQKAIDDEEYEKRKREHLEQQNQMDSFRGSKLQTQRDALLYYMKNDLNVHVDKLIEITGLGQRTIYKALENHAKQLK